MKLILKLNPKKSSIKVNKINPNNNPITRHSQKVSIFYSKPHLISSSFNNNNNFKIQQKRNFNFQSYDSKNRISQPSLKSLGISIKFSFQKQNSHQVLKNQFFKKNDFSSSNSLISTSNIPKSTNHILNTQLKPLFFTKPFLNSQKSYSTEKKEMGLFDKPQFLSENLSKMDKDDIQELLEQKLYAQNDKIYTIPKLEDAYQFPLFIDQFEKPFSNPDDECERGKENCFEKVVISTIDPKRITGETDDIQLNFFEYPLAIDGWRCPTCAKLVYPADVSDPIIQKLLMTGLYYSRMGNFQLSEFYYRRAGNSGFQKASIRALVGNFYYETIMRMKEQNQINEILFQRYARYAVDSFEIALKLEIDIPDNPQESLLTKVTLIERTGVLYQDYLNEPFKAEEYFEQLRNLIEEHPDLDQLIMRRQAKITPEDLKRKLKFAIDLIRPWLSLKVFERKNEETPEREGMRRGLTLLDEILKHDQTISTVYLWKFRILTALELYSDAFVEITSAVRFLPKEEKKKYLQDEIIAFKNIHDLDNAIRKAQELAAEKGDFRTIGILAVLYLEAGKYDEAQKVCRQYSFGFTEKKVETLQKIWQTAQIAKNLKITPEQFQEWQKKNGPLMDYNADSLNLLNPSKEF